MRPTLDFAILAGIAGVAISTVAWILRRSRRNPVDRERKRRTAISANGRLIEGMVTDYVDGVVYYTYSWRGVEYAAAQDVSWYQSEFPHTPELLIGAVTVKFLPADPSNSIVFSETWSGFPRFRSLPAPNTSLF